MSRKKYRDRGDGRKVLLELTRTGVFLWGGLFLFLLIWVFALGVLAGRGSIPADLAVEELREQMAKIQEIVRREGARQEEQSDDSRDESPSLSFYDKLTAKREESRQAESSRPAAPETRVLPQAETVVERPPPVVVERTPESPVTPALVEPPVPSTMVRREGLLVQARFTVQVAAVENRAAAEEMIARLKRNGHPAYYYDVEIDGKTFYRVRCGRFLSRTEAEEYARLLARKEGIHGFVSELE